MKKVCRFLPFFLAFLLILPPCAYAESLSVSAESAILIDGDSGEILYQKNAFQMLPMASTTKIMTALVAIEHGNLSDCITVPAAATGIQGSSIYLVPGEKIVLEELLYALLLASANDAAIAIALAVGGSLEGFADLMNQKAKELDLTGTHFTNPHGLDDENHYTTAYDLAKITAYALKNPFFCKICGTTKKTICFDNSDSARHLTNHNKLLSTYRGAIGVKTGFTRRSGRCLVSAAERDGLTLIAVTLSDPNDWQDHKTLLDFGFSEYESICLSDTLPETITIPVVNGDHTVCCLEPAQKEPRSLSVSLPKGHGDITVTFEIPRFLYAPLLQGQYVGRAVWKIDGKEIADAPLVAREPINLTIKKNLWERIADFFSSFSLF